MTTTTTATTELSTQVAFSAPPVQGVSDTLVQVRTGKVKSLANTNLTSAIHKTPHEEKVYVTKVGIRGDEQQYVMHGGVDKALHHYNASHYAAWKRECPQSAHRFVPGGFGENLVSYNLNEGNLCIGDVLAVGGNGVKIRVGEPRQPCFKLNHRFEVRNMSARSQDTGRTGWYYQVLQEGWIKAGDTITLIERKHPRWTISEVQRYLHHEKHDIAAMQEISQLPELGSEIKQIFLNRLQKEYEDEAGRLLGGTDDAYQWSTPWSDYLVISKTAQTSKIYSFILEATNPPTFPTTIPPGSHIRLKIGGSNKLVRAYSILGDSTTSRLEIAVALSISSRGGSAYLHSKLNPGDIIQASPFTTSFPLAQPSAPEQRLHHVLIAGGIGLTALLPMAQHLNSLISASSSGVEQSQTWALHICVPDRASIPFKSQLSSLSSENVHYHISSEGTRLSLPDLLTTLSTSPRQTHLYLCGPLSLHQSLSSTTTTLLPSIHLHTESFLPISPQQSSSPFTVTITSSSSTSTSDSSPQTTLSIPPTKTLLQILRSAGFEDQGSISSGCEMGNCGSCWVRVLEGVDDLVISSPGAGPGPGPARVGVGLVADENDGGGLRKRGNGVVGMLSCVDRAREGARIVLDL